MVDRYFRDGFRHRFPAGGLGRASGFAPAAPRLPGVRAPRVRPLRWIGVLGGAMLWAAPALAQNAAVIPVSVVVMDLPGNLSGLGAAPAGWMAAAGIAVRGGSPGRRYRVGGGALMVVPETIEPDRVRVRLEYVGN